MKARLKKKREEETGITTVNQDNIQNEGEDNKYDNSILKEDKTVEEEGKANR